MTAATDKVLKLFLHKLGRYTHFACGQVQRWSASTARQILTIERCFPDCERDMGMASVKRNRRVFSLPRSSGRFPFVSSLSCDLWLDFGGIFPVTP